MAAAPAPSAGGHEDWFDPASPFVQKPVQFFLALRPTQPPVLATDVRAPGVRSLHVGRIFDRFIPEALLESLVVESMQSIGIRHASLRWGPHDHDHSSPGVPQRPSSRRLDSGGPG